MSAGNERFNAEAAAWDSNPDVHVATDGALKAILKRFRDLQKRRDDGTGSQVGPDILEIGCGTGLLSLKMAPYAKSLLAVDAASGMIDALNVKFADPANPKNVQAQNIMLEDSEDSRMPPANEGSDSSGPRKKFDMILSHLVLHHIPDLQALLSTMYGCLKPGGWIALTDFEDFGPEARRFHPEAKMGGVERHGVNAKWFEGLIRDAGFADVTVNSPGWSMKKEVERYPGEWGQKKPKGVELEKMDFPFLLCIGRKP